MAFLYGRQPLHDKEVLLQRGLRFFFLLREADSDKRTPG